MTRHPAIPTRSPRATLALGSRWGSCKVLALGLALSVVGCSDSSSPSGLKGGTDPDLPLPSGGAPPTGSAAGGGAPGPDWGPDECPATPAGVQVGFEVGDQMPSLIVYDCDGNQTTLDELCGAEAFFLFAAHGWCALCQFVSSYAEEVHHDYASQGLASAIVVVENEDGMAPDAAFCAAWRDQFGLEDVRVYYDPTGALTNLWGGSSSLSAFVDRDRVITGKLVYSSSREAIEQGIGDALAD